MQLVQGRGDIHGDVHDSAHGADDDHTEDEGPQVDDDAAVQIAQVDGVFVDDARQPQDVVEEQLHDSRHRYAETAA